MPSGSLHPVLHPARSAEAISAQGGSASSCACELDSACLLQGQREVLIRHGGECYRLRHTRNGKLILTK
ncbi:MAG: hemin uptake protein HemP [Gammaproteobacteria bacterium]|nr:hemin uptake protein HemP [Gammaproteobacteria bacterium]